MDDYLTLVDPCPECGNDEDFVIIDVTMNGYVILCRRCGCTYYDVF